jgi:5-methylcytosine-specific restriction endonuclease McrA
MELLMTGLSVGDKMFASYADKYADWVARGKPPAPSLPSHWVWRHRPQDRPLMRHLAQEQGDACSLCGEPLSFDAQGPNEPTFEHVLPRSKGGGNHRNRLVAHRRCNSNKSDRLPTGCEIILLDAVNTRVYLLDPNRP